MYNKQLKQYKSVLFSPMVSLVYILVFCLFLFLQILCLRTDLSLDMFTSDIFAIANLPSYMGVFSNIGVLIWCSTAAVCFFSSVVLREINKEFSRFFLFAGFINLTLLLDDFFLFHDSLYSKVLHIPEIITYVVYAAFVVICIIKFKRILLKTEFITLLFALGFFAISVAVDIIAVHFDFYGVIFFEDLSKLLGIISWCFYFMQTAFNQIYILIGHKTQKIS
ncbi:MAG: hypothetical protein PHS66_03760 [Candidatus Omnitrophica bacterium]|nr:hypothetical protein [Candidatus Omnitrophota bacterium]